MSAWPRRRCARVRPGSARAPEALAPPLVGDRLVPARRSPASAAACAGRCRPARRQAPAVPRWHGLRPRRQPGSGGLPGGSFVLAVAEDRREFFCQYQQGGRFGQRLVLAVQLPLKFLDPAAVLSSFDGTRSSRLAEAGDRVLLPAVQLRRIQALLAAPGVATGLVHRRRRDHRFQARRRRPAFAAPGRAPWPRQPRANAPASPRSLPQHQPPNSPAATTARQSGPCTPVRIGPTCLNLRPWVCNSVRLTAASPPLVRMGDGQAPP